MTEVISWVNVIYNTLSEIRTAFDIETRDFDDVST